MHNQASVFQRGLLATVFFIATAAISACKEGDGPMTGPGAAVVLSAPGSNPLVVEVGESASVTGTVSGAPEAESVTVTFAVNDPDIASVTATGPQAAVVTGKAAGTTAVTATARTTRGVAVTALAINVRAPAP